MKIYIPFNSNDFNSVFTTLSISPYSFYPNRKYSFKRATTTLLNENEDFLIGYEKPVFHNKDFDKDYGFPFLLEIDVDKCEDDLKTNELGIRYLLFDSTVYLFDEFKLVFRREKELNETLAKSLKSIETKFANLAKQNSIIIKEECFVSELPQFNFPTTNPSFNEKTFHDERRLNRILGAILGSSIAFSNSTTKEWQDISNLLRTLNNTLSLYLNKLGENSEIEKNRSIDIIEKISKKHEEIETLEEAIMLESSCTSDLLNSLKLETIFNQSAYDLIIEGLLISPKLDLPLSLKLEKLKRAIKAKFSSKYFNNYIEKVNNAYHDLRSKIESEISNSKKLNKLSTANLVKFQFEKDNITIEIPSSLSEKERTYLEQSLAFFVQRDDIVDVEMFFINKKEILVGLAKHFTEHIREDFEKSKERDYLLNLLSSFDNIRVGFQVSTITNEVLKSIAILFTSGRDFLRFIENNEREEIQNTLIYYSLWGAIYGAAIIPKTLTESITDDKTNLQTIISAFKKTTSDYFSNATFDEPQQSGATLTNELDESDIPQEDNKALATDILVSTVKEEVKTKRKPMPESDLKTEETEDQDFARKPEGEMKVIEVSIPNSVTDKEMPINEGVNRQIDDKNNQVSDDSNASAPPSSDVGDKVKDEESKNIGAPDLSDDTSKELGGQGKPERDKEATKHTHGKQIGMFGEDS